MHVQKHMFHKTHPGESEHVSESQMHPTSNEIPTAVMSASQHLREKKMWNSRTSKHTLSSFFLGHGLGWVQKNPSKPSEMREEFSSKAAVKSVKLISQADFHLCRIIQPDWSGLLLVEHVTILSFPCSTHYF